MTHNPTQLASELRKTAQELRLATKEAQELAAVKQAETAKLAYAAVALEQLKHSLSKRPL